MNCEFLGLGSNLKENLYKKFDKNEKILYVFENNSTFFEIKKDYFKNSNNLFYNFTLMTKNDFFEKILETNKIVVKEEKQVMLFYNALTPEIKENLNINSYYDVIDIAYNFYNLFAELQEYKVDINKIELEKWQKPIFQSLVKINEKIEEIVEQKELILPYMLRKIENVSKIFMKKYEKIIFVNKIYFTPFEKELFNFLENNGIILENVLLIDKKDFDEKELKIKDNFSLPKKEIFLQNNNNIKIYKFDNKFAQLLGIIKKLDKSLENKETDYKIYDVEEMDKESAKDYHLLNQNRIKYNFEENMENTLIYKVLNIIFEILENIKNVGNKKNSEILFRVKEIHKGFKNNEFIYIFDLKNSYNYFQKLISRGYKYISINMLKSEIEKLDENSFEKNNIEKLVNFLEKIEKIYNINNLEQYGKELEEIFLKQSKIENKIREKYFEALSEVVILEKFSFDNLWKSFFDKNISASLLKLFLKYLDKKSISLDLEEISEENEKNQFKINSFSSISELQKGNVIFLNLQESFPRIKVNNYLFSKNQRINIGLPVSETLKKIEIYKFLNNIFGAKNVCLSYIKNVDKNINSAGIIEEIKLKYDINEIDENNVTELEELLFIKKYFNKNKYVEKKIGNYIKSTLNKNKEDIKNKKLILGYYSFDMLRNSPYCHYITEKIGDIEVEKITEKIDPLLFGTIIHKVYEIIVMENKEKIEQKNYFPENNEIEKIVNDTLNDYKYKIPEEYIKFYKEISFDEIVKAIKYFFESLNNKNIIKELKNIEKFEIYSEEKIKQKKEIENEKYKNIMLSGAIDLYIKNEKNEILMDYKTGKLKDKKHKNKALEQLDFYSEILGEEKIKNRGKYVVDTWSGEIIEDKRKEEEILTKEKIEEVIKQYNENTIYDLGEKSDTYTILYKDIMRKKDEK